MAIVDEQRKRIFKRNLQNDPKLILSFLAPYRQELAGIVVESTFNWYWLVDALMDRPSRGSLDNPERFISDELPWFIRRPLPQAAFPSRPHRASCRQGPGDVAARYRT